MRRCKARPRRAKTLAGEIEFRREVFECPVCRRSEAPLDAEMGIESGEKMTRGLTRKTAWLSAHKSFQTASAGLAELLGLRVSPAECQRVTLERGRRIDALQRRREELVLAPVGPDRAEPPEPRMRPETLVLLADAGTVLTRKGQEHKSVYCGRAVDLADRIEKDGSHRPVIVKSLHTASAVGMEDFGVRMKALARDAGLRSARVAAFIADGAAALWNWAESELPPGTILIQDYWHVCEHLAGVCREVYGESAEASPRLERWRGALKESRLDEILDELRGERKKRRGSKRERLEREIGYLEKGRHRMDYAEYRRRGLPIGSGAVESEVKCVVKERFGVTGARWSRENIAAPLALRVAIFNGDWDAFWTPPSQHPGS